MLDYGFISAETLSARARQASSARNKKIVDEVRNKLQQACPEDGHIAVQILPEPIRRALVEEGYKVVHFPTGPNESEIRIVWSTDD